MVKTNSIKAWFLAARPKTLTAAAVPVLLGISMAWTTGGIRWVPALLCLLFAWVMQIDSNLVNDYFDFKHGNDDETRLGPKRACAEGWITLGAMKIGIAVCTLMGCAIGLPLVIYGGWEMVMVGIACVVFCFLYTTTLSYWGLGDVLVLVFFGIVPVCCTYFLVMPESMQMITGKVAFMACACGLVVDTLLVVNNYRDYDNDLKAGKKTLIVHIGKRKAEILYSLLGNVGIFATIVYNLKEYQQGSANCYFLPLAIIYIALHNLTYREMKRTGEGRELNQILGKTARNIFIFGIVSCLIIIGSRVH